MPIGLRQAFQLTRGQQPADRSRQLGPQGEVFVIAVESQQRAAHGGPGVGQEQLEALVGRRFDGLKPVESGRLGELALETAASRRFSRQQVARRARRRYLFHLGVFRGPGPQGFDSGARPAAPAGEATKSATAP